MSAFSDAADALNDFQVMRKQWAEERKELEAEAARLRELVGMVSAVEDRRGKPKPWTPKKSTTRNKAVVTCILSDLHLDEVVRPEELNGVNAFNRRIAEQRLARWTDKACSLPVDHLTKLDYEGCCLFLGGDVFSGDIHEELRRTNADTIAGSVAHWLDPLHSAIAALADTYGRVTVDVVAGNHGRNPLERRSPAKGRARDNFDTLMGWLLQRDFRGDDRVEFNVSESPDVIRQVYATTYLLTHGDQARGGSGIAGALSPLMLLAHRKAKRQSAVGQPYDIAVMGHWHQLMTLPAQGLIVNGSLKGMDEYAAVSNFAFEPPQQALWITTPEHGPTVTMPVRVCDRKAEKW